MNDNIALHQDINLEQIVLEDVVECEKGLWELCWELRSSFHFEGSDHEIGRILKPVVQKMMKEGFIKLLYNQWGSKEFTPVPESDEGKLLDNDLVWSAPPTNDFKAVWCMATEKGNQAWSNTLKKMGIEH